MTAYYFQILTTHMPGAVVKNFTKILLLKSQITNEVDTYYSLLHFLLQMRKLRLRSV